MPETKKYIFENGLLRLNPAFTNQTSNNPSGQPNSSLAMVPYSPNPMSLTVVSSPQDVMDASAAQAYATGRPMQLSEATTASMEIMQDAGFLNQFQTHQPIDGGRLLDGLTAIFSKYEVPIGLVNKLLVLSEYKLNFIIDDSGSMGLDSDAPINLASPFMRQKCDPQGRRATSFNHNMTRWEEAEDRIHVMMDMLAFIPCDTITISFLNRRLELRLEHRGKTPEQFAQDAHQQVSNAFRQPPEGQTPIYSKLHHAFNRTNANTMHYLFTDGVPTDRSVRELKQLVLNRNTKMNPLTFMSCTNEENEANWMKEIEGEALFTAELDDFETEKKEVQTKQGPGLPFTRGFWLLCQLVAAINPFDLDAMDESVPFSKMTMDNLMGRKITLEEYEFYFRNNPYSHQYAHLYNQFSREDIMAHQILGTNVSNQSTSQSYYHPSMNPPPYNPNSGPMYPPRISSMPYPGNSNQNFYPNNASMSSSVSSSTYLPYHAQSSPTLFGQSSSQPPGGPSSNLSQPPISRLPHRTYGY